VNPTRTAAALVFLIGAAGAATAGAQRPITRADAVESALARGPRLAAARADTALAAAQVLSSRLLADPALAASYSKGRPRYHVVVDLPFDFLGIRSSRLASAEATRRAASFRYDFERASVELDADTTYTKALATLAHSRLSASTAADADQLRTIAIQRRDAGDASELDVELATVNAGQEASIAASDSLAVVAALLDLQSVMGLAANTVLVTPSDSLAPPSAAGLANVPASDSGFVNGPLTLPVAAASEQVTAAALGLRVQRRSVLSPFGINAGIEAGGAADEPGILPTVGITLPLPFLNRNRGGVAEAQASLALARAELDLARIESAVDIAQARRAQVARQSRVGRDRLLVVSANRVAAMSLTSYREGAAPLATVLEARRTARDVLARYIDDVADAWITTARLRMLTLTAGPSR
jgi:outer membrane protein, heavy metal efflux system